MPAASSRLLPCVLHITSKGAWIHHRSFS
jgi:hypothetical protein